MKTLIILFSILFITSCGSTPTRYTVESSHWGKPELDKVVSGRIENPKFFGRYMNIYNLPQQKGQSLIQCIGSEEGQEDRVDLMGSRLTVKDPESGLKIRCFSRDFEYNYRVELK